MYTIHVFQVTRIARGTQSICTYWGTDNWRRRRRRRRRRILGY
jgi:hypothetical protein